MNYIGSKKKLLPFIEATINKITPLQNKIFCDLFAGTGIVGSWFKPKVKTIISNDVEYYSWVLNMCLVKNNSPINFDFSTLNNCKEINGFITKNYCEDRKYFTIENGKKIDAIRQKIELYKNDENLYFYLLASLLEASDAVANTASVYGAYLKKIKKSASRQIKLQPIQYQCSGVNHQVFNEDANQLIKKIKGDILYLDPPYNARQYGSNYHLLNTIAKYTPFEPSGKTGLPDYFKSKYCNKNAEEQFNDLIKNADFEYIFLSYNNEGIISPKIIKSIMSKYGEYSYKKKEYQRFKADNNRDYSADKTVEYIHILKKE